MKMSNKEYSVDFEVLERKALKLLDILEERRKDACKRDKNGHEKHKELSMS